MLIPEIWARLDPQERSATQLIKNNCLEKLDDFEYQGKTVLASRLGYRITERFVASYLGKIFDSPAVAFDEALLKPETQGMPMFVDGIQNIVDTQQSVAQRYIEDGSAESACPPLKALLYIMANGEYEGKDLNHPYIRNLFNKDALLSSGWYQKRLKTQQMRDAALWKRHIQALGDFLEDAQHTDIAEEMDISSKLEHAKSMLQKINSADYLQSLTGTIGADPL